MSKKTQNLTIKVNHLCGLAETLNKMGQGKLAEKALNEAISSQPNNFLPYLIYGIIHYDNKNYIEAMAQLKQAKTLNPFHEETCNYYSLACYHSNEPLIALESMIDAYLLSGEFISDNPSTYQQRIKIIIENLPNFSGNDKKELFRHRQSIFEQLYSQTLNQIGERGLPQLAKKETKEVKSEPAKKLPAKEEQKLRQLPLLSSLTEDQLNILAQRAEKISLKSGEFLFREDQPAAAIFICLSGKVVLQKNTPFGQLIYREINQGGFLGEEHLLDSENQITDAYCPKDATFLVISKDNLQEIFLQQRELAIHFFWYFYKNIGRALAQCYTRLLPELEKEEAKLREKNGPLSNIELQKDLASNLLNLENKNLSRNELRLLEAVAPAKELSVGTILFREKEKTKGMYVIVAGSIVLNRNNNQVLSILEVGDCCAETSLIADLDTRETAHAFSDQTKVLLIDRQLCSDVVKEDPERAYLFLSLLCRLLGRRLLTISEKIFQLKMILNSQQLNK